MGSSPETDQATKFEQRVHDALALFEHEFRTAVQAGTPPPKTSMLSFTKGRVPRSVLYEDRHLALRSLVETRLADLRAEADAAERAGKKRSVKHLTSELAQVRKERTRQIGDAIALSFTDLMDRGGPAFRERRQIMAEIQHYKRTIEDLEKKVERQAALIETLYAQQEVLTRPDQAQQPADRQACTIHNLKPHRIE